MRDVVSDILSDVLVMKIILCSLLFGYTSYKRAAKDRADIRGRRPLTSDCGPDTQTSSGSYRSCLLRSAFSFSLIVYFPCARAIPLEPTSLRNLVTTGVWSVSAG